AERGLDTVNQTVGTVRERIAKIATDLARAERELDALTTFTREIGELENDVKKWIEEVGAAAAAETNTGDLRDRIGTFEEKLRAQLRDLGHSAITKANAH